MLEKTLESPLDCKEIQPVSPKGYQPWIFIGRTDAEAPILWPPDVKNWLIRKDRDPGKDWRQEDKGTAEDEMVGWYHWLNGHEFEHLQEMMKDKETWDAAVHGVVKNRTWLSDWTTKGRVRSYEWTLSQFDWCPSKKRKLEHRHKKTMWGQREKMATYKSRREVIRRNQSCPHLDLNFQLPELWENKHLLFKPPSLAYLLCQS